MTTEYTEIDRHALRATRSAERTLTALAAYLKRGSTDPRITARAIFRWITDRIDYADNPESHPTHGGDPTPAQVLRHRQALCGGIARLYQCLGELSGLEVTLIQGHVKGRGYTIGQSFRGAGDHLWNAVRLGDSWHLLDATWGAGVMRGRVFQKSLQNHYFLTPPKKFRQDHLPDDPAWQLCAVPLSKQDFQAMPRFTSSYFSMGLQATETEVGLHTARDEFSTSVFHPPDVRLTTELWSRGRPLPKTLIWADRTLEQTIFHARFPRPGSYLLRIFAARMPLQEPYKWVLDYRIQAQRGWGVLPAFPEVFADFSSRLVRLLEPREGKLESGTHQRFSLEAPGANAVALSTQNEWVMLTPKGNTFTGIARIPKGTLTLAAQYPGQEEFPILLRYQTS